MPLSASRGLAAALILASTALFSLPAAAHAIIVASSPASGAVLAGGSVPVMLRFNSRIDRERSRLSLIGPDGKPVALPLDSSASADSLVTRLSGLKPGKYRLRWQVLAIDGHITRGDIPFVVAP
jgi:copper resistance protein C